MGSLEGKTIVVTRAADSSASLVQLFEQKAAKVIAFPTIEIVAPDAWDECDHAIINLRKYDGVFFTSKNAVEKFIERITAINSGAKKILASRRIFAVGEKTEAALEEAGIPVSLTPEIYSAENLASALSDEEIAGKHFLFPKSSIGKDVLPNALRSLNAVVDEVAVYKTISPEQSDLDAIRNALAAQEVDVVTFFSPSSVRNFIQIMGTKCLDNTAIAVIGPSTAKAATDLRLSVSIIAKQATAESLVETIEEYFALA
ncbi:MAG: uroporphyrinogen-III synthase [Ignavibacteriales bacterium]|nr:uroporphyrinogen-III synthase [Ignavibacteriales bacterium]